MLDSNRIKQSLNWLVTEHIKQQELEKMLLDFIEYKSNNGFPFGELLILHYNMFGGEPTEEIYKVAAAIELLILAFDILDDFEDNDVKDKPWSSDVPLALNSTTALIFLSGNVIQSTNFQNKDIAASIYYRYSQQSIIGQHKDLLTLWENEKDFINMTLEKSGSLVTLSCLIGAALATDNYPSEVETYSQYIGLIGQIENDLKDLLTWDDKNDLLNKKYSLPIIYLLNCEDEELAIIHDYYNNKIEKNELLKHQQLISEKIIETGAITYTKVMLKLYQNKVADLVKKLNLKESSLDLILKYVI